MAHLAPVTRNLQNYVDAIRACRLCEHQMTRAPNPIVQASATARILVAGQAPGNLADRSGQPFTDPSGVRLREWMGVSDAEFYEGTKIAIAPMGFCFPGNDAKGGDLPPMKICAPTWREGLLERLPALELVLAVGGYAQAWHLGHARSGTLTETVRNWRRHLEESNTLPMPHPSWRNNAWLRKNIWFETELLPVLRERIRSLI